MADGVAVARRPRRMKQPAGDRSVLTVNYLVLAFFGIAVLYPLIYVVSASFSSAEAITSGAVKLFPVDANVDAYRTLWQSPAVVQGFLNSLLYSVSGAVLGTALTVLAGYPLSRPDLQGRRTLTVFLLVPAVFSAGIIPTYVVVQQLGMLNTRWAIILPGAMSVFNVIITRTFYQLNIPHELLEASRVDGANDFAFFLRVALPLSKPIIAVNLLFYGIAQWNGWFSALIYLTDQHLFPLQLVLRDILIQNTVEPSQLGSQTAAQLVERQELFNKLKYALIVVGMLPPLLVYPFVQKYFVKGALIGSLK
ncbi:carbohydrate ABC transporter permease [Kribbella italica]|uniref:Multiple sugar transport system permease protein/putative aldouronate transport system permease protein n=1 Tax=Kribbella italica TaxID=1540520 RepID=A0A7W9J538_9ACTN|nr:carbohydrate ABC transporter permease [Kribbella italica]MBB5835791.1 multiple sugar transport system permease protein/putative aldouronate transport system permease protein [Kribbella italica]